MRQSWIHTNRMLSGSPAIKEARFDMSPSAFVCADFDDLNGYCGLQQPKLGGLDNAGEKM